ncbi:L-seryl-tRNA(Sec) selenium transferase [Pirellula staleyi DSM 6068]|uniref:L-seryl-tRNA(Sec) selenium transferase n=1 Tax=Pirellula staleyi (strain ATCC 27377 / DSM 6068 / ICPB 4128) TaxID=530564 RepID=D2R9A9_PIRSD|nr:L-selenocysteinyl-tRNA(Sec) synthase [Pirellula staleyi]ADB17659.1 L-seryl-tRNA(Sec) selenium transferase [Pirellula staleyi DSM 6068]
MSSVLKSLPSVSELLDSAPLKSLVSRVSQSTVLSGVRRFLDQVRSEIPTASQFPTTAADLADRIARWISREDRGGASAAINATGVLLPAGMEGPPLADEAVQAIIDLASSYIVSGRDSATNPRAGGAVAAAAMRLTGSEDAAVYTTATSAVLLAAQALARGREVIVARGDLTETPEQSRWLDVLRAGGVNVREIGAANLVRIADFSAAITPATGAILRLDAVRTRSSEPSLGELTALAREHKLPVIQFLGVGGIVPSTAIGIPDQLSAAESIAAGVDLAIVATDALTGGPRAGLAIGKGTAVESLRAHPLAAPLALDRLLQASLLATLELYLDPSQLELKLPLYSLLATPLANLQNRAERIAPQLHIPGVIEAIATAMPASLQDGSSPHLLPSYGIELRPLAVSKTSLKDRLARGLPAVIAAETETGLLLNLKTVLPRQDLQLATILDAFRRGADESPKTDEKQISPEDSQPQSPGDEFPAPEIV